MDKTPEWLKRDWWIGKITSVSCQSIQGFKRQIICSRYIKTFNCPHHSIPSFPSNEHSWANFNIIVPDTICFCSSSNLFFSLPGTVTPLWTPHLGSCARTLAWLYHPTQDPSLFKDTMTSVSSPAWHTTTLKHLLSLVRSSQARLAPLPLCTLR